MSTVLTERFSRKKTVPYENTNSADMSKSKNAAQDSQESNSWKDISVDEGGKSNENKWFLFLAVHFCNVLYSSCFWINVGVYPYITKSLGVDIVMYGYLQTVFAALQLAGGTIFGRLGDVIGSRAGLVLAHACGFMAYFLVAAANGPAMLFLSRVPGILMHGSQVLQNVPRLLEVLVSLPCTDLPLATRIHRIGAHMVMTDLTTHEERAVALGKLGFSYGAGVILGPFIGGQISKYFSQKAAMMSAAFLSIFAMGFVMVFIPKFTRKKESRSEQDSTRSLFDFKRFKDLMLTPGVGFIYLVKLISGLPFGIFQSMFALVVVNTFRLTPAQHGMFMSYIGSLMILAQGFGVGFITSRMNEKNSLVFAMILCLIAYILLIFSSTALHLCVMVAPLVFGGALFGVITNSILTKLVPPEDTGFVLGVSFATHSLIRTVAPTIGGLLLSRFGYTSFGGLGVLVCSATALILFAKQNLQTTTS